MGPGYATGDNVLALYDRGSEEWAYGYYADYCADRVDARLYGSRLKFDLPPIKIGGKQPFLPVPATNRRLSMLRRAHNL